MDIMELVQHKEIITNEEVETKVAEAQTLTKKDIMYLRDRTAQLFEVMEMCEGNEEQIQLCRNEIIELNIRLVPHVLKKYKPFGDDEFQLGCLGLIIATRTFDPSRGVPYVNYACFCIERELHKAHKKFSNSFEYLAGGSLSSLDDMLGFQNGDEVDKHDIIPDVNSQKMLDQVLEDFALTNLFDEIIYPSIELIGNKTKGQATTVDFNKWRQLEMKYLLEMAQIDSQKARLTFSSMAADLGVSVQNIRMRHKRVVETIKEKCIAKGIEV